jgi:hypothetical protein
LTGQQRQEIWTRAGMVPISLPRQPLVLPQWVRADIWGSLSVRIWPRRAAMISNVVDLRPARKGARGVAQRNDVHDVLLQAQAHTEILARLSPQPCQLLRDKGGRWRPELSIVRIRWKT